MKKKKNNLSRYILLIAMIAASTYFITKVVNEVNTTYTLKADLEESKKEKAALIEQKKKFEKEKSNLTNEEYVVRYARGKYMLTKEDSEEQVFKLPTEE